MESWPVHNTQKTHATFFKRLATETFKGNTTIPDPAFIAYLFCLGTNFDLDLAF